MRNDSESLIKPALTAEEWEKQLIPDLGVALHEDGLHVPLWTNDSSIPVLDGDERHALAALALYDQPFGFTREDVSLLNEASWDVESGGCAIRDLAKRIEALLPPKAK